MKKKFKVGDSVKVTANVPEVFMGREAIVQLVWPDKKLNVLFPGSPDDEDWTFTVPTSAADHLE